MHDTFNVMAKIRRACAATSIQTPGAVPAAHALS